MTLNEKQKKILIVTKKDLLIDVVSVFLEGLFPSEIEVADSSRKLEAFFERSPYESPDLLIVEDERLLLSSGKSVADFLAPAIIVGNVPETQPISGRKIVYLPHPVNLTSLASAFEEVARVSGIPLREYCPVRLEVLVLFSQTLAQDLYRKLPNGTFQIYQKSGRRLELSPENFSELSHDKFLYLKQDDFHAFMKAFAQELQSMATSAENTFELGDSVKTVMGVHELIAEAIPEMGFTPELQQATRVSIDLAVSAIKKDPRLNDLIAALTKMDSEYRSWHSVALCYMSCRLSSLMTWDSANTHYKLSLAAFLHDIKLPNSRFDRAHSLRELDTLSASDAEIAEFRDHPHSAAALARQMKDFPGDVDHIIAQHHELPGGDGFPLGLNHTKISPLASLFIVAHDLTEELFDKQSSFSLKESVKRLEKTYTQGYFKRVIASLKELVQKESA